MLKRTRYCAALQAPGFQARRRDTKERRKRMWTQALGERFTALVFGEKNADHCKNNDEGRQPSRVA
jgi:hypothetical protein